MLPESKRTGESLLIRWEALDSEGAGALDSPLPPTVWPEPPCPPPSLQVEFLFPPLFFPSLIRPPPLVYLKSLFEALF